MSEITEDVIYDQTGKIVYFSPAKFREQIIEQNCCFICGISRTHAIFSDEHIFPKWMLDEFDMHGYKIELPNGNTHQYGTYVVPCCAQCNSRMGKEIEKPISELIKGGYKVVNKFLDDGGDPLILYCWLARIFLKTHLKDLLLRKHLDPREGTESIGGNYRWEGFYIPFCISRAFYAGTVSLESIMGSFILVPIADNKNNLTDRAQYSDDTNGLTLVLQVRDMGFVASFGDFGISLNNMQEMFKKIKGRRLNPSQLGQLGAYVSMTNTIYKNKPRVFFESKANRFISVPPEDEIFHKPSNEEWGSTLYHFTRKLIMEDDLAKGVKAGTRQFLWDKNNDFITTHLE